MFLLIHYYFLINDLPNVLIVLLLLLFNWCNHTNVIIVSLLLLSIGNPLHVHVIPFSYSLVVTSFPPYSSFVINVITPNPFVDPHQQQLLLWILLFSLIVVVPPFDPFVHPQ